MREGIRIVFYGVVIASVVGLAGTLWAMSADITDLKSKTLGAKEWRDALRDEMRDLSTEIKQLRKELSRER